MDSTNQNAWLLVTNVSHRRRDMVIRLEAFPAPTDGSPVAWMVTCRQVCQFALTDFDGGGLNQWTSDHPVLSQFSSRKASLRMTLRSRNRPECVGVLVAAHWKAARDWIDFGTFVPSRVLTVDDDAAIAITGPEFLVQAYHDALLGAGFRSSMKKHKRRLYWSGFGWSERRRRVSLLHFGSSFIVAESFTASADTQR